MWDYSSIWYQTYHVFTSVKGESFWHYININSVFSRREDPLSLKQTVYIRLGSQFQHEICVCHISYRLREKVFLYFRNTNYIYFFKSKAF